MTDNIGGEVFRKRFCAGGEDMKRDSLRGQREGEHAADVRLRRALRGRAVRSIATQRAGADV